MTDLRYFYSSAKQDIDSAIAQIDSNCNWPDNGTETWDLAAQHTLKAGGEYWMCQKPPKEGSHGFTQAQMLEGVASLDECSYDEIEWPEPPEEV